MAGLHGSLCTCGLAKDHLHDAANLQESCEVAQQASLGWSALPLPVWEVVADSLTPEDVLAARLVCRQWAQDFGALVDYAVVLPVQLAAASRLRRQRRSAAHSSSSGGSISNRSAGTSTSSGCRALCTAFPYMEVAYVDVSSTEAQALACKAMTSIVARSKTKDLTFELDALPRCYHCHHKTEAPTLQGELPFADIPAMARRLQPAVLDRISALYLDCFPEQPEQWQELAALPALKCLSLPLFKPSLSYSHVPHLAWLTQLDTLTLSIQGSFMDWPATSAAFSSLSALTALTALTLHAFHCCSPSLSDAVWQLRQLRTLSVSGRVLLSPATRLEELSQLQHLDVTQDIKDSDLVHLLSSLTSLTHLQVGKLLPPPPQPPAADPAAAGAGPGGAAAGAAAGPVAGGAGAGAGAAAGAGGGGAAGGAGQGLLPVGNDNIMEDLGAIVDGLIANMEPGVMPEHLQRVIERFEMLMQLDLTRHSSGGTFSAPSWADYALPAPSSDPSASSTSRGLASLELSLHKVADLHTLCALQPLPQLRRLRHLAIRLRDCLLGGAAMALGVLEPCHALRLGGFGSLHSLCLSGKLALRDDFLVPLLRGIGGLRALSLDAYLKLGQEGRTALAQLTQLQALTLRHRGSGKNTVYVMQLPRSLKALTLKRCCVVVGPEVARTEPGSPSGRTAQDRCMRRQYSGPLDAAVHADDGASSSSSARSSSTSSSRRSGSGSGLGRRCQSDVGIEVPPIAAPSVPGPSHPIASPSLTRAVWMPGSRPAKVATHISAKSSKLAAMCLPQLESLLLHSCLAEGAFVRAVASHCKQLNQLGITGEVNADAFELWANELPSLRAIQVLDLTVPEATGPRPLALRDLLLSLPRLVHVHLAMSGGAAAKQLLLLGALKQLRTLAVDFAGPPQLPCGLKDSLQAAMPCCKVQIWEQLQLDREAGSWANANACVSVRRRRFGPGKWAWGVAALMLLGGVVLGVARRRGAVMRSLRVRRDLRAVAGCGAVLAVALQG